MENKHTDNNSVDTNTKYKDLKLNQSVQLSNEEFNQNFNETYKSLNLNSKRYDDLVNRICVKTNNLGDNCKEVLKDMDLKQLDLAIKNTENQFVRQHLLKSGRIVKKEVIDFTEEYRPATYFSRFAIILRSLPSITAKLKAAAYASEVGESFRPVVPRSFVNFLYLVSIGYVILDISGRTYCVKDQGREKMLYFMLDTTLFHLMASLVFPAVAIHKIVKLSQKGTKKLLPNFSKTHAWIPALIALCSVPFIISPIDHATEFILDKGIRPFYIDKIAEEKDKLHHH